MTTMRHPAINRFSVKIAAVVLLVATADWFFYDQPLGCAAGFYAALALGAACLFHPKIFDGRFAQLIGLGLGALLYCLIEAPGFLAFACFATGLAVLLVRDKRGRLVDGVTAVRDIALLLFAGAWHWYADLAVVRRWHQRPGARGARGNAGLHHAVLPVLLAAAFVTLFSMANPLIAKALAALDWSLLLSLISAPRWLFWFGFGLAGWALLRPRSTLSGALPPGKLVDLAPWLTRQSLTLSLLIFNALFLVQNALDAAFLWSGKALPEGMTWSDYARDGAYPLLFTVLLAAAYVLLTFGESGRPCRSPLSTALVHGWILQNVFLTLSAMNRTLHYIEAYSLTTLRVAALVWMGLVAAGLMLVLVRIHFSRSNTWLINANAALLALTLYACCFVNIDRLIANYNVRHAWETGGGGAQLDLAYMESLGPEAIDALGWFAAHAAVPKPPVVADAVHLRAKLTENLRKAWTSIGGAGRFAVASPLLKQVQCRPPNKNGTSVPGVND